MYTSLSALGVTLWLHVLSVLLILHCIIVSFSLETSTFLSRLLLSYLMSGIFTLCVYIV